MVGASGGLQNAVHKARLLANVDAAVLLLGETGVGKEVFARAIHEGGCRASGPFVALNCGGLPRELLASELFGYVDGAFTGARRSGMVGKLEAADGGTLFLDELAEMPLDLQPYLLRVLEGGEVYPVGSNRARRVHFRLVAACNRDLRAEVNAGRFRMDLFYRVSVATLRIPPLRERLDDLPALVQHFSQQLAARQHTEVKRFSPEVLVTLATHSWRGNLRELRNIVEAVSLMTDGQIVDVGALPPELTGDLQPVPAPTDGRMEGLERVEREAIRAGIHAHRGNLTRVARQLRISRSTLYVKVKKYELEATLNEWRANTRLVPDE